MMRTRLLLPVFLIVFVSCSVKEKPEFLRVEHIEVKDATAKSITLKADAYFNNPNDVGGTLKSDGIMVLVNDVELGKVSSEDFKVPAKEEFSIPMEVTFSTEDLVKKDAGGVLGGILNSIFNKSIKVQYKGEIIYKALGFSYTYPIDKTETVTIKL